jgi:hypothetical protein
MGVSTGVGDGARSARLRDGTYGNHGTHGTYGSVSLVP